MVCANVRSCLTSCIHAALYCVAMNASDAVTRCSTDGHRPAVDLEDAALVTRLFALFHGTPRDAPSVPPAERATPAGPALQARLMGMFTRSAAAANAFPAVLQARLAAFCGRNLTLCQNLTGGCCRRG